ncbi:hypothetical protein GGI35DRAFT_476065 [Trichoderma velutinum]
MDINASSLFNVNGLVALITGGGTGIGLMMTQALVHNGAAKVYIAGRRLEVLQVAANSLGPRVIPIQCDITSKKSSEDAAAFVEKDSGYLNLLICNSGTLGPMSGVVAPDTTVQEWASTNMSVESEQFVQTFSVNSVAMWYTSLALVTLLEAGNKKGNVEQTSSIISVNAIGSLMNSLPGIYAYAQSKAAALSATKQLSHLLSRWNMRANCIMPGYFPSDMADELIGNLQAPGSANAPLNQRTGAARPGDGKDMAGVTLFLASRAGAYTNGTVVVVDGGVLAQQGA